MNGKRIRWEITPRCNLKCKHCFAYDVGTKFKECSPERRLDLAYSIIKSGIKEVVLASMEPLLINDLPVLIHTLLSNNIDVTMITNGVLLEDKEIFQSILDSGLKNIFISMEGISSETNDYIRGNGSYEKVVKVLNSLNSYSKNIRKIKFGVQMSINSLNIKEVENILPFFEQFDEISLVTFGNIGAVGNAHHNKEIILSDQKFLEACEKIVSVSVDKKLNYEFMFKSLLPYEVNALNMKYKTNLIPVPPGCGLTQGAYTIIPDGSIYPCSLLKGKFYDKYNFFDEESNKIMRSSDYEENIHINIEKLKQNGTCFNCKYFQECKPCLNTLLNNTSVFLRCQNGQEEVEKISNYIIDNKPETIKIKSGVDFITDSLSNKMFARKIINSGYWSLAYRVSEKRLNCVRILSSIQNDKNILINEVSKNREFIKELLIDGFLEGDVS